MLRMAPGHPALVRIVMQHCSKLRRRTIASTIRNAGLIDPGFCGDFSYTSRRLRMRYSLLSAVWLFSGLSVRAVQAQDAKAPTPPAAAPYRLAADDVLSVTVVNFP